MSERTRITSYTVAVACLFGVLNTVQPVVGQDMSRREQRQERKAENRAQRQENRSQRQEQRQQQQVQRQQNVNKNAGSQSNQQSQRAAQQAEARAQAQRQQQEKAQRQAEQRQQQQQQQEARKAAQQREQQEKAQRQAEQRQQQQREQEARKSAQDEQKAAKQQQDQAKKAEQERAKQEQQRLKAEQQNQNKLEKQEKKAGQDAEKQTRQQQQQAQKEEQQRLKAEQDKLKAEQKAQQQVEKTAAQQAKKTAQETRKLTQQQEKEQRQAEKESQRQQAQELKAREKEEKQAAKEIKLNDRRGIPGDITGAETSANDAGDPGSSLTKKEQRKLTAEARKAEKEAEQAQKQLANAISRNDRGAKLTKAQRAVLIGADIPPNQFEGGRLKKKLSGNDVNIVINKVKIKNVHKDIDIVNNGVWNDFRNNRIPDRYRPYGSYGRIREPLFGFGGGYDPYFLPPPAPMGGSGLNINFSWNYWDGRSYYDHDYASNLFISVGHTRYNGYDGIVTGGRYWSYGYGWVDGCIDYGSRRMWIPGMWVPYTVEECGQVPIWMPPVYQDVWTGCCWERIQVDGGYFMPSPPQCHLVTRYSWIPGHYEYYY